MSMEFNYGMLDGTKSSKLREFNGDQDRLCMLSRAISEIRLDLLDTTRGLLDNESSCYDQRIFEIADLLEEAIDKVWSAICIHHHALPDYIAEGYPRR